MKLFLVGGAVRDLLLGRPRSDEDILVFGMSREEFRQRFPMAKEVGRTTPSFVLKGREYMLPRGPDIDADLAARDLTINALALDEQGQLYAHPRALEDLHYRILRPASPDSLIADPVRVLRAARFSAELPEFTASGELLQSMREAAQKADYAELPRERVSKEILKAMGAPQPSRFVGLLAQTGALAPWFAEIEGFDRIPAGPAPYHTGSLLAHLQRVMDRLAGSSLAVWMGLCHDLGKAGTDPSRWPKHHKHDKLGAPLAEALARRLGLPERYVRAGRIAAALHMTAAHYSILRPGTRVDILSQLHNHGLLEEMFALIAADQPESAPLADTAKMEAQARHDLQTMLKVRLPPEDRNRGPRSGQRLRELRCLALAKSERRQHSVDKPA
ncbi:HD domain-containing protein [Desulfocurvibacter africanus]|uniref:Polynucleotide adenylyltransferase/metal dependent phosphohydrolase n=1 Tax=Desulfocurvibacter africanus subsp. africanus str. Walvis Bay TaxID=690850 RepID=F3Z325_DESAF|nr:HD domain-containing protein [Desulfocurvibacter africanus]EGJ51433.1 polynucleotide adenylyltransferase/metal dependent phosphohydrolase [Desulfocurvibacter africanus subsp. africanus str. Walvis Bay]